MRTVLRNGRKVRLDLAELGKKLLRVAFYVRVSSEEQALKQTPRNQIDYLERHYARNFEEHSDDPMVFVGSFVDDGVSGTVPFDKRPEGRRLMDLAAAGGVDLIVFYKLDRFGRKVTVIYDAFNGLDQLGVAIASATEPWETRTAVGKMIFGLLAVLAEFEREVIKERTALGRDRHARLGEYINGVLPLGYDVVDGRLAPSTLWIQQAGMNEADLVRLIFQKIAEGDTSVGVANWLNALGVPSTKVYVEKKSGQRTKSLEGKMWFANRISRMIHNPLYHGSRTLLHDSADITQDVAPLVSYELWDKAEKALGANSSKGYRIGHTDKKLYTYLLGGKIFCADCDSPMQGNLQKGARGDRLYYGCARAPGKRDAKRHGVCTGFGYAEGYKLEALAVDAVDRFMASPQAAMESWRQNIRDKQGESAGEQTVLETMHLRMAALEESKSVVLRYVRTGRVSERQGESELDAIGQEMSVLRREIDRANNHTTVAQHMEQRMVDVATNLERSQTAWAAARASDDRAEMREVIQKLLGSVHVHGDGRVRFEWFPRHPLLPSTHSLEWADGKDHLTSETVLMRRSRPEAS